MTMVIPTILCGGVGARLWPVSRSEHPKPFIELEDGISLIQKAFLRSKPFATADQILTVTNQSLLFKIQDEYNEIDKTISKSFILEPFGKNTAAALVSAALSIEKQYGSDAVLLVLTADHLIEDQSAFEDAVNRAIQLANDEYLVTFGIHPDKPETGFGYIEAVGTTVKRFVEKPDYETACQFLQDGNYFWNSGMFCFKAGVLIKEIVKYAPALLENVKGTLANSSFLMTEKEFQVRLNPAHFGTVEDISIDYAVMEKSDNISVVTCDIGWSDIGAWDAMSNLVSADQNNNAIEGEAFIHNAHNCYVKSDGRVIGLVNVDDLIVVDTDDALLVANKNNVQDVKIIYEQLKQSNHPAHKFHQTVHRPWGTYTVLENGEGFKIKRIVVKPGASLSLQMHHHRSEHWIVVSGAALVINGDQEIFISTNESTYIPAGHKHRLTNPGKIDLILIEVQSGAYLEEDDIIRFEDVYGRS